MAGNNLPAKTGAVEELEAALDRLPDLSIEEVIERTLARTLAATTPEEVLADPEATGLREYSGRVITLIGVLGCLPSRYDVGLTRYLVLDIADPGTGEKTAVTTGSAYVIARALKLAELGALPAQVRVLELESASNPGQTSLWITKP